MPKHTPVLSTSEPDPALLNKLVWLKRALLALVALIAVVTLAGRLIPTLGRILPDGWQLMEAESGFAALFSSLRSEEHKSELQSPMYLVCRLLLEKKKKNCIKTMWKGRHNPCGHETKVTYAV